MSKSKDEDPMRHMKAITRGRLRLMWQMAEAGDDLSAEDARTIKVMRDHPEYADLWGRLDELSDAEIERDGVNPIAHIIAHTTVENQIAENEPKEVRQTIKKLMRQGYTRHDAIHAVGGVLMDEIWYILKENRPFDEAKYLRDLKALTRK
ncbi:MAG TPA: DUF1841 family protein [Anaerolineales bacterium]